MWIHVHLCGHAHVSAGASRGQKRALSPIAGVMGDCEPSDLGPRKLSPGSARAAGTLTTMSSFQSQYC